MVFAASLPHLKNNYITAITLLISLGHPISSSILSPAGFVGYTVQYIGLRSVDGAKLSIQDHRFEYHDDIMPLQEDEEKLKRKKKKN